MPPSPHSHPLRRSWRRSALACSGVLAIAAPMLTTTGASAVTDIETPGGATFVIHDAHRPSLDTGSIRSLSDTKIEGFGSLFLQVDDGTGRMNGQMLRGFGVTADEQGGFRSTRSLLTDGIQVSRELDVTGERARFLDTFTNTTAAPVTLAASFGGSIGYGTGSNALMLEATDDGNTSLDPEDSWLVASWEAEGTRPVGIAVGHGVNRLGDHQADPFTAPYQDSGSRANHPGFVHELRLEPGETQSLLGFVVVGDEAGEASEVTTTVEELAQVPDVAELSDAALCTVVNWEVIEDADCEVAGQLALPSADISTLASDAATTTASYDVTGKSIAQLQADMRAGTTTSVAITQAYLDRIAAYDGGALGFRSYISVAEDALDQAAAADASRAAGADTDLLGIPLGIKDLYDTHDQPTTGGTLALEGYRPAADAWQIARLREAGAIILGKTNLSEFANSGSMSESGFMQTWNALYPSKTSHGSSGGSGTAVAADLAAGAMGSQTGVSLYAPATSAGLATFRGTDGLSSTQGVMPLTWAQDYAGPMAKTVTDLATLLDATSTRETGNNPADLLTSRVEGSLRPESFTDALAPGSLEGKVLGVVPEAFASSLVADDPTGPAARTELARLAASAGATVVEMPAPDRFESSPGGSLGAEGWARYIADQTDFPFADGDELLSSDLVLPYNQRESSTEPMTEEQVETYLDWRDRYKEHMAQWMDEAEVDAVVYPGFISAIGNNDVASAVHTSDRGTGVPTSSAGLPTVVVPAGVSPLDESMSLQIVGRAWSDAEVLGMGYALEQQVEDRVTTQFAAPLPASGGDVETRVEIGVPQDVIAGEPAGVDVEIVALGSASASGTVVLEVAGRTFTAPAVDGAARIELPAGLPAGEHEVEVRYAGDHATQPSTATALLTVIDEPTEEPTEDPTEEPTEEPTAAPTDDPTDGPTEHPTAEEPTTDEPTEEPATDDPADEPATDDPASPPSGGATDGPSPTAPAANLPSTGAAGLGTSLVVAALLAAGGLGLALRRTRTAGM